LDKSDRALRSVVGIGRDLSYQIVALPHAPWHPAPVG